MEPKPQLTDGHGPVVVIEPGRAPVGVVLGAVDATLRSELPGLAVHVALDQADSRRETLLALCGADSRVTVGGDAPRGAPVFAMPARARPEPRTLPNIAALIADENLAAVDVAVPGRYPALATLGSRGKLHASGDGSGRRTLRAAEVGLRSTASRGAPGPPPKGSLAAERTEHLRHRARSATMRARMDRNAHRLSRERLQTRHERTRLRLAEQGLARTGGGEWVRWRSRNTARRVAALPGAAASATSSLRGFGRRARRFAVDRWRSRKLDQDS